VTSETPTDDSDRSDEKDCEKLEFLQQEGSAPSLLRLEFQARTGAESQPDSSTLPGLSLPALLTGGNVGNATEVRLNSDGQQELNRSGLSRENPEAAKDTE
jgi:hypothetical protein